MSSRPKTVYDVFEPVLARFRPSVHRLDETGRPVLHVKGGAFGANVVIIPRARCEYRFIRGDYASQKQVKALRLRLRHEAHFDTPGIFMRCDKSGAEVWTWDQTLAAAAQEGLRNPRLMPESALFPDEKTALKLVHCMTGFEGQGWRNSRLVMSRWWPQPPNREEWSTFARTAGIAPLNMQDVGEISHPAWQPPGILAEPALPWLEKTLRARFGTIGALILIPLMAYQATIWISSDLSANAAGQEISQIRENTQDIIAARRKSLSHLRTIRRQAAIGDEYVLVKGVMEFADAMADSSAEIQRIQYDAGSITVHLDGVGSMSSPEIVETIETLPSWEGVNLQTTQSGQYILRGSLISGEN